MRPALSAVICTHGRAHYLPRAIESLLAQDTAQEAYEILVVDNASRDETAEVVTRYGSRVRAVQEPTLGLSHARNRGWREAGGRYVALLDDDAVATPGWVRAILDTFANVRPEPGAVGGPIRPIWEAARPAWLSDAVLTSLAILDWSERAHAIEDLRTEWLAGANLAMPRVLLEQLGGFATALDRVGTRLLSGGDVHMQMQIAAAGRRIWYEPSVEVAHHVPAERLEPTWFRRRYFAQGLSDIAMQRCDGALRPGAHPWAALRGAAWFVRRPRDLAALFGPPRDPDRFTRHCFAWIRVGQIAGLLSAGRESP